MTTFRKLPIIAPRAAMNAHSAGKGTPRALSVAGRIIREIIVARLRECDYDNFGLPTADWHIVPGRREFRSPGTINALMKIIDNRSHARLGLRRIINHDIVRAECRSSS